MHLCQNKEQDLSILIFYENNTLLCIIHLCNLRWNNYISKVLPWIEDFSPNGWHNLGHLHIILVGEDVGLPSGATSRHLDCWRSCGKTVDILRAFIPSAVTLIRWILDIVSLHYRKVDIRCLWSKLSFCMIRYEMIRSNNSPNSAV